MICGYCGNKIPKDSGFCPSCGKKVEYGFGNKNKNYFKRIIGVVVSVAIIGVIATVIPNVFYSKEKVLKAYREFYNDFYREYADEFSDDTLKREDCSAKIVLSKSGKPMVVIEDIVSEKGDGKANVYLYSYEWGKVKEKASLHNIPIYSEEWDSEIKVFNRDDKLYLSCMDSVTDQTHLYVYDEKEQEFVDVPTEKEEDMKTILWLILSGRYSELYELSRFQQNDFEYFLKNMTKKEVKNGETLRKYEVKMANILEESNNISFNEVIVNDKAWYLKDEKGTITLSGTNDSYISDIKEEMKESKKNIYYSIPSNIWIQYLNEVGKVTEKDMKEILLKANEEEVNRIASEAFYNCDTLEHIEIPSNIQMIGDYAFQESKIKSVQIQNGVKEIEKGAFYDCNELEALEVPDSVVAIGDNIISEYAPTIIYCDKGSAMESYAKENELYYVNGTIEKADSKQVEKIKKQIQADIEERKWKDTYLEYFSSDEFYESEAYDQYVYLYDDEAEVQLVDINQDGRPEIFLLGNTLGFGEMIFYITNDYQVEHYSCGYNAYFQYIESEGKLFYFSGKSTYNEVVCKMDNQGRLKEEHIGEVTILPGEDDILEYYTWDGEEVTKQEYDRELNKAFNYNKSKEITCSEYGEVHDTMDDLEELIKNY